MLNALLIDASDSVPKDKPSKFWLGGVELLSMAESALRDLNTGASAPTGRGTLRQPWVLNGNALTWLNLAKTLYKYKGDTCYFWICGRIVKKLPGYYMVDAGGVNGGSAWDQMPRWDWNRREWVGFNFVDGGPSYRNFANYMENIRNGAQSEEVWSAAKAEELRAVLSNENAASYNQSRAGVWSVGQVLPALAATLFLAEPGRNIRTFFSNRALLDMMQAGMTYGGRKPNSAPKLYTWKKALLGDSNDQLRGGKSSAANAGSGNAGKDAIALDASKPGTGNYSQAKEVTLLARYLTTGRFEGTEESLLSREALKITFTNCPAISTDGDLSTPTKIVGYLKYLIQYSVKTWKL